MEIDVRKFAESWIAAWNTHDLSQVLVHYAEDLTITSPLITVVTGQPSGVLTGKPVVAEYWQAALQKYPALQLELVDAAAGVDSVALYYRSVGNRMALETMWFNEQQLINRVVAHYT